MWRDGTCNIPHHLILKLEDLRERTLETI